MIKKETSASTIAKSYDKEVNKNKNSVLNKGSYMIKKNSISFLMKRGEGLVIDFSPENINIISTLNHSVIQTKGNTITEVKNKIYIFAASSKNKEYWTTLAELV